MDDAQLKELKRRYEGKLARLRKGGVAPGDFVTVDIAGIVLSIEKYHSARLTQAAGVRFVEEAGTLYYFNANGWELELHPGQEGA